MVTNTATNGPTGRGVGWGDMGKRFRDEWPDVDAENWKWIQDKRINPVTGIVMPLQAPGGVQGGEGQARRGAAEVNGVGNNPMRRRAAVGAGSVPAGTAAAGAVVKTGETWVRRHKVLVGAIVLLLYVFLARVFE